jgi:hypothetical protein
MRDKESVAALFASLNLVPPGLVPMGRRRKQAVIPRNPAALPAVRSRLNGYSYSNRHLARKYAIMFV